MICAIELLPSGPSGTRDRHELVRAQGGVVTIWPVDHVKKSSIAGYESFDESSSSLIGAQTP